MKKTVTYSVPDTIAPQQLLSKISKNFKTTSPGTDHTERHYQDTFDWRLYRKGLTLYQEKETLFLVETASQTTLATTNWPNKRQIQSYLQLPHGEMQEYLRPILEMRATLPLARIMADTCTINVLNKDRKSIYRLFIERLFTTERSPSEISVSLTLSPMRGYSKEAKKFHKFAHSAGLKLLRNREAGAIFEAAGHTPCAYSNKLRVKLSPKQQASLAAVKIFKSQIEVMRLNENGIKDDIDSEFLHDFRVALRRTRAGLSQFKGIFSPEVTKQFKRELAALGKMTNRLRDLDVYLLKREYYREMLPEQLRPNLDHLFKLLSAERNREKRKVINSLNAPRYKSTISNWTNFLDSYEINQGEDGSNSCKPILVLAKQFIFKTWKKAISNGRLINQDSPDAELHMLRLDCKKLRYLLEFFSSLFPKEQLLYLIKQLKKLQDNLGDFNDICVQQETLHEYLEHRVTANQNALDVAAAIGGLISNLNHRQQEIRLTFEHKFRKFDHPKNNQKFHKLFKNDSNRTS